MHPDLAAKATETDTEQPLGNNMTPDYDEIMQKRQTTVVRMGYDILEAHPCEKSGGGVILGQRSFGVKNIKAFYFRPRSHKRTFHEEIIESSHARIAIKGRTANLLLAEKNAKKAPHDLKCGDIIARIWGATMQDVNFFKVLGVPSPREVSVVPLDRHMVSGDWMAGSAMPVDREIAPLETPVTYEVDMSSGTAFLKTGNSIVRMSRWSGSAVSVYSD